MPFTATWMELEIIIVSEVNQRAKEKYHMTSLTCVKEKKKIQMKLFTDRNRLKDFKNKLMVAKGERLGREEDEKTTANCCITQETLHNIP